MTDWIATLPMYDWPEGRVETDADWARLRVRLRAEGVEAPEPLARRNADLPAVPGGIAGPDGQVVAPDPAGLPPDGLDYPTLFRHPRLLLGQTCWGPLELGLAPHVIVVGQPSYDGIEGGQGELYSSAILVRRGAAGADVDAPADGRPRLSIERLRGARFAYNGPDSMSGMLGLQRDLEAAGEGPSLFAALVETGSHRASVRAVAAGAADVCAVDCRSWALARRHEPAAAAALVVAGWTGRRRGLPYITSRHTPPGVVAALRRALASG